MSWMTRYAADPLRFEPPARDLLWSMAADPGSYETVEISHAVHRLVGDRGFVRWLSEALNRLSSFEEEIAGGALALASAKRAFDRGEPISEVVSAVEAAFPEGFRKLLAGSLLDWASRRRVRAFLSPAEYASDGSIHYLLEGDPECLKRQLVRQKLLFPGGTVESVPEWSGEEPLPEIEIVGAAPGAGRRA